MLFVYSLFFFHVALWYHFGFQKLGHLGFGCILATLCNGVVNARTIFTLLIFLHAMLFVGLFCGWFCHWGMTQDVAAWIMQKCGIKPKIVDIN